MKTIYVKITAHDDYDDVHDELMLADAQTTPEGFEWELMEQPVQSNVSDRKE